MLIIPAIDIYENKVVRLNKGNFKNISFYENTPLQQAKIFESEGFGLIHIVDLLGSKSGKYTALETIKEIKSKTNLKIQFGGGVRSLETAKIVFDSGIDFIVIGSLSVKNRNEFESIIEKFSPQKLIAAIDVKDDTIFIQGWTEKTKISLYDHINYCLNLGIEKFLCTDINKDGMLTGSNVDLYKSIINNYKKIKLIASGGIKNLDDIKKLNTLNLYGAVVGKAIYENKINLKELPKVAL